MKLTFFDGSEIKDYESIHFKATENNHIIQIHWVQNLKYSIE